MNDMCSPALLTPLFPGAGLKAPADAILEDGEVLPAGTYWMQPKSALVLEAEPATLTPPTL